MNSESKESSGDAATFELLATVIVVIPEYRQAILRTDDGEHQLAITRHTTGVTLADVKEGQVYWLTVTQRLGRVLHARLTAAGGYRRRGFPAELD